MVSHLPLLHVLEEGDGSGRVVGYRTCGIPLGLQKRPASAPRVGHFSVPLLQGLRRVCDTVCAYSPSAPRDGRATGGVTRSPRHFVTPIVLARQLASHPGVASTACLLLCSREFRLSRACQGSRLVSPECLRTGNETFVGNVCRFVNFHQPNRRLAPFEGVPFAPMIRRKKKHL